MRIPFAWLWARLWGPVAAWRLRRRNIGWQACRSCAKPIWIEGELGPHICAWCQVEISNPVVKSGGREVSAEEKYERAREQAILQTWRTGKMVVGKWDPAIQDFVLSVEDAPEEADQE